MIYFSSIIIVSEYPVHELEQVSYQLFGKPIEAGKKAKYLSVPPMNGFIAQHKNTQHWSDKSLEELMTGFDPSCIPIFATLAEHFVLFDRWFSSAPTCTFPNRNFVHMNTADGISGNSVKQSLLGFTSKTMWEVFGEMGLRFTNYWQEFPTFALYKKLRKTKCNFSWLLQFILCFLTSIDMKRFSKFYEDAARGTLPDISFTDHIYGNLPWNFGKNNDGHAPIDYSRTELLLKKMY